MRELESVNEHFRTVFQFVETSEVKVDGSAKEFLHKASLAPVKIDFYLAGESFCLFKIDTVLVTGFS